MTGHNGTGTEIDPGERDSGVIGTGAHGGRHAVATDARADPIAPIPASIVKAVCTVQATVASVAKTSFNEQGRYKFASTDDIYASISRKFGEVGLMIYPIEMYPPEIKRVEKTDAKSGEVKVSQWGHFCFGYMLCTEQDTWFDPRSSRTIFIQILGPQTFNAAESYCQKQYLRSLLKIPTGDQDLDSMPQADNEDDQVALSERPSRKSSAKAKRDGDDVMFNEIRGAISSANLPSELMGIRTKFAAVFNSAPSRWHQILEDEYADKMQELEAQGDPQEAA